MKKLIVKGTWEEMGRMVGEKQKKEIHRIQSHIRWTPRFDRLIKQQISYLERHAPDELKFLRGVAEGSHQSFERIVGFCSWEYFLLKGEHCSTILGEEKGKWFIAHNEDDSAFWRGKLTLLQCIPKNGVHFMGVQYPGTMPGASIGMNSSHVAISMNNLSQKRERPEIGIPSYIAGSRLLQSSNWKSLVQTAKLLQPNAGMHFLVMENSRRAISLEYVAGKLAIRSVRPGFVHSNHAILSQVLSKAAASQGSKMRLNHLEKLSKPCTLKQVIYQLRLPVHMGGVFQSPSKKDDTMTLATVTVIPSQNQFRVMS